MSLHLLQTVSRLSTSELKEISWRIVKLGTDTISGLGKNDELLQPLLEGDWPNRYCYLDKIHFLQDEIRKEIFYRFLTNKL